MIRPTRARRRIALSLAVSVALVGLMATSSSGAGVVNVSHAVTNQWTTGYEAAMTVRNDTGSTLTAWRLEFDMPHLVSSIWGAVLVSQVGNHVVIDGPAWQRNLAPGAIAKLGYVAGLSGARQEPVNCRVNGVACSFNGAPTSTTVPPTTVPPTTSTTVPPTTTTTVPPAGGVNLSYRTTDRWDGGYNAQIDIVNGGPSTGTAGP